VLSKEIPQNQKKTTIMTPSFSITKANWIVYTEDSKKILEGGSLNQLRVPIAFKAYILDRIFGIHRQPVIAPRFLSASQIQDLDSVRKLLS
jgi:hypothetical protein